MLIQKYAGLHLAVNLLCVLFGVDSNQTIIVTPSVTRSVQSSLYNSHSLKTTEVPPVSTLSYKITVILARHTTFTPNEKDQKMEGYIIIVIITLAVIALLTFTFLLVFCIFRKRRTQRLERERNLSYNNMNYESTVKFSLDKNGESGALGSSSKDDVFPNSDGKKSPAKKANNNQREYEVVDLPNSSDQGQRREYENVTPENFNKHDKASSPNRPYENVTPAAIASKDNNKGKPTKSQYEQVELSSSKTDEQKSKNKQYENVDPPNLSR